MNSHYATKLGTARYASFDHQVSEMRIGNHVHVPDYFDLLIAALKRGDNEGARAIADAHERAVKSVAFDAGRISQMKMSNEMFAEMTEGIRRIA